MPLRSHGGRRPGAGRKPKGPKALVSHAPRPRFEKPAPVHVTLRMLRELGSTLPVEVWHLPGELTAKDEKTLRDLGATPRSFGERGVIVPMKEVKGRQKNFQIKVAAWVNSGFEEIIGLDSDVLPVRDPEYLFETEEYRKYGQIFWPDWWKTHRSATPT